MHAKIFSLKEKGIYKAINYGIKKTTGDIVHILHSDDIYRSSNTITDVINIIKDRNEKVGTTLNNILQKYFNDPELAIKDINKVVEESKNVAAGEISKNNGIVALLKGSDGKKYSIFTDGDLFFYKPSYDEIITTLKNQKFEKDESGTKMVLSNAGENFKMEKKHICEFPFP